jgi:hypothetical protein
MLNISERARRGHKNEPGKLRKRESPGARMGDASKLLI